MPGSTALAGWPAPESVDPVVAELPEVVDAAAEPGSAGACSEGPHAAPMRTAAQPNAPTVNSNRNGICFRVAIVAELINPPANGRWGDFPVDLGKLALANCGQHGPNAAVFNRHPSWRVGSVTRTVAGQKITGDESPVEAKSEISLGSVAAGGRNTGAAPTTSSAAAGEPSFGNFITIAPVITDMMGIQSTANDLSGSRPQWLRAHPGLSVWLPKAPGNRLP